MPFRDRSKKQNNSKDEKLIEINAEMQGDLSFKDPVNLKINASYSGNLEFRGMLTVGEGAQVQANIKGESIVIAGKVTGNIKAKKVLVLMPTAVLNGDISAPKLNIVEGALFSGKCKMQSEDYLNIDDLAQYLEIEKPTIVELANAGKIPAIKEGDSWKFERIKIDDWASSGKV